MAKLGVPRHRYAVTIFSWFHVVLSILLFICWLFDVINYRIVDLSAIIYAIGMMGLYCLYTENSIAMRIFGCVLIIITVLLVFLMLSLTVVLATTDHCPSNTEECNSRSLSHSQLRNFILVIVGSAVSIIAYIYVTVSVFALARSYK